MAKVADGQYCFDNLINAVIDALEQNAVISGMAVTQRAAGANMSVDVAAGTYYANQTKVTKSSTTNVTLAAADPTKPRKDIIVADSAGNITKVTGTAEAVDPVGLTGPTTLAPKPENIPSGKTILAEVWVGAGETQINNGDITDRRLYIKDFLDHSARHEDGGSDELFITGGMEHKGIVYDEILSNPLRTQWEQWNTYDMILDSPGGTGAPIKNYMQCGLSLPALNDTEVVYQNDAYVYGFGQASYSIKSLFSYTAVNGLTRDCVLFIGFALVNTTVIDRTTITKHIGFIVEITGGGASAKIYAVNADGTNRTETDCGNAGATTNKAEIWWDKATSNLYFYINGTLKATHTTNITTTNLAFKMSGRHNHAAGGTITWTNRCWGAVSYLGAL